MVGITKSLECLYLLLAQKWIVAYPDTQLLSDVIWFAASFECCGICMQKIL